MTAPLHVAEQVAAEIVARMARCTKAQGAETDLGRVVYQGRRAIDDQMIPCCVLIEGDDVPNRTPGPATQVNLSQRYVLFAYVPCDPDHPNVAAHAAIRDMKRAVFSTNGKPDRFMGGRVRALEYLGRDIGPRADGNAFVLAAIEVGVEYVETLGDP